MNQLERLTNLPDDLKSYQHTKWGAVIDQAILFLAEMKQKNNGDVPATLQSLATWTQWMIDEGHRLPDEEVYIQSSKLGVNQYSINPNICLP